MRPPTRRQTELLRAIVAGRRTYVRGPTRRELREAIGAKSTNSVTSLLRLLGAKGLVEVEPWTLGGVRLTDAGLKALGGA